MKGQRRETERITPPPPVPASAVAPMQFADDGETTRQNDICQGQLGSRSLVASVCQFEGRATKLFCLRLIAQDDVFLRVKRSRGQSAVSAPSKSTYSLVR